MTNTGVSQGADIGNIKEERGHIGPFSFFAGWRGAKLQVERTSGERIGRLSQTRPP